MRRHTFATWLLALSLPLGGGCGHDHSTEGAGHEHSHSHSAQNGGSLVMLEPEFANVEVLVDPVSGTVNLWSYDAHVENMERLAQTTIQLTVAAGDAATFDVTLAAVASGLTGDAVGDSAAFRGQHSALIDVTAFAGRLGPINSRGKDFPSTTFVYPAPNADEGHDHEHK